MPIVRIPYPNALPAEQNDYVKQNNLIETGFLQVNKPIWEDAANNIVQGAVFQVGGTVYYCTAATAIGGGASNYIKLTPSGDGSTLAPTYVVDLTGVTWDSAYNGYYDVSGNAYVFDELVAIDDGELAAANTRLWKAFTTLLGGNFTFSGVPVFSGDPTYTTSNSIQWKLKIVSIGAWNMMTTPTVTIAHGLILADIIAVQATIINDAGTIQNQLPGRVLSGSVDAYIGQRNATTVSLHTDTTGGYYYTTSYDGAGNRGWIPIIYKV